MQTNPAKTVTTLATTPTQVLGPNPRRVAVLFSLLTTVNAQTVDIDFDPNVVAGQGAFRYRNNGLTSTFFKLTIAEIGTVICEPLYGVGGLGTEVVSITEIICVDPNYQPAF